MGRNNKLPPASGGKVCQVKEKGGAKDNGGGSNRAKSQSENATATKETTTATSIEEETTIVKQHIVKQHIAKEDPEAKLHWQRKQRKVSQGLQAQSSTTTDQPQLHTSALMRLCSWVVCEKMNLGTVSYTHLRAHET